MERTQEHTAKDRYADTPSTVQVVVEVPAARPLTGPFAYDLPALKGSVSVGPDLALRRASGYLILDVGLFFRPGEPRLVLGPMAIWRLPIFLQLRDHGALGPFGELDVDSSSGDVLPLTEVQIASIQQRAETLASRLSPQPALAD